MNDLIYKIKTLVKPVDAALVYDMGIKHGMICCPFHKDDTPSLKLYDDHFYCYGCGEYGDVINLTAGYFNLSAKEAVRKLSIDFGLSQRKVPEGSYALELKRQSKAHCRFIIYEYICLLSRWQREYAPKSADEEPDERYVEACLNLDMADELLNLVSHGSEDNQQAAVRELIEQGVIAQFKEKLKQRKEGEYVSRRKCTMLV